MVDEMTLKIRGYLSEKPTLKYTPSGMAVTEFIVANTPVYFDQETHERVTGEVTFMKCLAWRDLAENIVNNFNDNDFVLIFGILRNRKYVKEDGDEGLEYYVDVEDAGLSLR